MYKFNQIICLWEIKASSVFSKLPVVIRVVLVRVIDLRERVLGEHSGVPSGTGIKAIDPDGVVYEKHWDIWPEAPGATFHQAWTMRGDSPTAEGGHWIPFEAVVFYEINTRKGCRFVDATGQPIEPTGDVQKCERHGIFHFPDQRCSGCIVDEAIAKKHCMQFV